MGLGQASNATKSIFKRGTVTLSSHGHKEEKHTVCVNSWHKDPIGEGEGEGTFLSSLLDLT